ncbi:MAG: hypothetical protein WC979_01410 [Candidatus Pacearchaeota archaeon]|jgi:hypothetical protein|nr:hypothetical protein [Clostridia bacterium]
MSEISIKDWANYKEGSDAEANYYLLLAVLKKVSTVSVENKSLGISILKDMMGDLEMAHLEYFEDPNRLKHLLLGKYVVSLFYMNLKHKDKILPLDVMAQKKIWKKIKIESTTAV